jgi:hypothetical protein
VAPPGAQSIAPAWLQLSEHIEEPGDVVFRHACKLGHEGIVSKRLGSPYISGRSRTFENPAAPAVSSARPKRTGAGDVGDDNENALQFPR